MAITNTGSTTSNDVLAALPEEDHEKLKRIGVNGVELHYVEQGSGEPVVFVHGGLVDYRRWEAQLAAFSQRYRVIVYSRRYNFPNNNPEMRADHSASVEAEDLAALIIGLKLGPVHIVGESMGASAGLLLGIRHPELVRTLVLAEPPELRWVNDLSGGPAVFDEFMHTLWEPVGQAFRDGNAERAFRLTADVFFGPGIWDELPDEVKDVLRANQRDWQALTTSNDSFPILSRTDVQELRIPTLMLTGGKTLPIHHLVNDELERLLPGRERVRLPEASHEMWVEFPELCRDITFAFLAKQP